MYAIYITKQAVCRSFPYPFTILYVNYYNNILLIGNSDCRAFSRIGCDLITLCAVCAHAFYYGRNFLNAQVSVSLMQFCKFSKMSRVAFFYKSVRAHPVLSRLMKLTTP